MADQDKKATLKSNSKDDKNLPANKATSNGSSSSTQTLSEAEQLNSVRQLLFGEQVFAFEKSLQKLNTDLSREINLLSKKMETDLNDFHHEVELNLKEIINTHNNDSCDSQLKQQTIEESLTALNDTFIDYQKSEKKSQDQTETALRDEIEALRKELDEKHNVAMDKLKQAADELKDNKADKNTLASMLSNMASNLQDAKD